MNMMVHLGQKVMNKTDTEMYAGYGTQTAAISFWW